MTEESMNESFRRLAVVRDGDQDDGPISSCMEIEMASDYNYAAMIVRDYDGEPHSQVCFEFRDGKPAIVMYRRKSKPMSDEIYRERETHRFELTGGEWELAGASSRRANETDPVEMDRFIANSGLDRRCRNILRRGGFSNAKEITVEKLMAIRDCGDVSIAKIIKFRDRVLSETESK